MDIKDRDSLRSVSFLDVLSYLSFKGWKEVLTQAGFRSILRKTSSDQEYEAAVPLDDTLTDYPEAIYRILQTLSEVENRSQLDLLKAITSAGSDVIRVRAIHESFADGTVPLNAGAMLFESARSMLIAAALAADNPRSAYGSRRPDRVDQFLKEARLGQTEQGSYIVTLCTRVPPSLFNQPEQIQLDLGENLDGDFDIDKPFERMVTETLAKALKATKDAIAESSLRQSAKPFEDAVAQGVSANLLDSIVAMTEIASSAETDIAISWTPTREPEEGLSNHIRFNQSEVNTLKTASKILRERAPNDDFELEGMVVGLEAEDQSAPHIITVKAKHNGQWRKIKVELTETDYKTAMDAHENWYVVLCEGQLLREGRQYSLKGARNFRLNSEEPPLPFNEETGLIEEDVT